MLYQLCDLFAMIEQILRPAGEVRPRRRRADAEHAVEGGKHVRGGEGSTGSAFAPWVGGADDLAHLQTAAGDEGAAGTRPVTATVGRDVANARLPAELAPDDDRDILGEAAFV